MAGLNAREQCRIFMEFYKLWTSAYRINDVARWPSGLQYRAQSTYTFCPQFYLEIDFFANS